MGDADGGFRLIHMLSAGAAGTEGVDLQIRRVDVHLHLLRLRQDGHRGR